MFFPGLHRRLSTRIFALVLSVALCGGTLNWVHAGGDDPECAPQLIQHDHAAHRFATAVLGDGSRDEHCTLCHLLQVLQSALPSGSLLDNRVSPRETQRVIDSALVTSIFNVTIPSRAPPAAAL